MSDKVKQLAPIIWQEIQKANKILLCLHAGPDPDSAGSSLAMMHILKSIGKNVTIIAGDSALSKSFSVLPGSDEIISKNYFEIVPSEYDLFIILDSGNLKQISKLGEIKFPEKLKTIKIDHHPDVTGANYADINLIDVSYGATCHIIYDLMLERHLNFSKEIAICLFSGIYFDTGGFKYLPTNYETFLAASNLVKITPDYFRTIFEIENSKTPKQLEFLGLALSAIEHYFSNKVALVALPYKELQKHKISKEDTRNVELPNILKSVTGWIIGISFIEKSPGIIDVSFRKREYEGPDLSLAATALGGGGHPASCGTTMKMSFQEAKKSLIETFAKLYPELGKS